MQHWWLKITREILSVAFIHHLSFLKCFQFLLPLIGEAKAFRGWRMDPARMDPIISQTFSSYDSQMSMNIEVDIEAFTTKGGFWNELWSLLPRSPGSINRSSTLACGNVIFTLTKNITDHFWNSLSNNQKFAKSLAPNKTMSLSHYHWKYNSRYLKWNFWSGTWANGRNGTFKGWLMFPQLINIITVYHYIHFQLVK